MIYSQIDKESSNSIKKKGQWIWERENEYEVQF